MSSVQSAAILAAFAALQPLSAGDLAQCRYETLESVSAAGISNTLRDMLLRRGLANRCSRCGKCPDMSGG